jgi:hypothetical protein
VDGKVSRNKWSVNYGRISVLCERIKFAENLVFVLRIEVDGGCALFRNTCIAPP